MENELIPLTYEEAIAQMAINGEYLVNEKEPYDNCHYHWNRKSVVNTKNYDYYSDEYLNEIPKLFLREPSKKIKNKVFEAAEFAALKHKNQKRKGKETPYIYHPLKVYEILKQNNCPENILIAGLLHDTLEDTDATPEEILNKFGEDILNIVKQESQDKTKTWKEQKQATIDHLENASQEVKLVCCADKLANLREMHLDLYKVDDELWKRFNASKEDIEWYYCSVADKLQCLIDFPMYKEFINRLNMVFGYREEELGDKITEDNWIQYGPHMELSVLSLFPYPAEWRTKIVDNKKIKPKIPEAEILKNKVDYVKKIYAELKNEFNEIEFKNDLTDEKIELLCDRKENTIYIDVNINLGIKRFGRISFRLYGEYTSYLNTKIFFIDEDEHQCREEINSMMDRLVKVTNAFCGTLGLETDVWNIFKLDELPLYLPMYFKGQNTYGIERIYWKK